MLSTPHNGKKIPFRQEGEFLTARDFKIQSTVSANVAELRRALGSIAKPLSLRDFAAVVEGSHPTRKVDFKMIERWESGVEPDVVSIAIMAGLAGVSFEAFALGSSYRVTSMTGEESVVDVPPTSEQGINRSVLSAEFFDTSKAHELTHVELEQMKAEKAARSAKPKKRRRA